MTSKEINKLIEKYLKGQATLNEIELLNKLDAFAKQKNQQTIFKNSEEENEYRTDIFKNIQQRIPLKKAKVFSNWYKIAAVFVLFIGIAITFKLNSSQNNLKIIANNSDNYLEHKLPDGSIVTLNKSSKLTYGVDFNKNYRKVTLSGEGYFKVAKNKQKPFIVKTCKVSTEVLGTQFNVKTSDSIVQVTVTEGLVKVYDNNNNAVYLKPNQQALYSLFDKNLISKSVNASLVDFWAKKEIILNSITLKELVEVLEKKYKAKIVCNDKSLMNHKLTISINNSEELDKVIERINLIGEIILTKNQNNMIEVKRK